MRTQDFQTLSQLVYSHSGLVVQPEKAYLFETRLEPVARKWRYDSIERLTESLRLGADLVKVRDVVEAMTTNESSFFRDSRPFDLLREKILPQLVKTRALRRSLRIWSAAASAGQEAYSIAMLLKEYGKELEGWTIEIIGTDLSTEMVSRASAGIYSAFEIQRGVPTKYLIKYFTKSEVRWQIKEELRRCVRFQSGNLLHDLSRFGTFDIIFCRNVLIYFDVATKTRVLKSVHKQTAKDGYLLLGAAETVIGVTDCFRPLTGTQGVYIPAEAD